MSELEKYVLNEQVRKIADHIDFGVISMLLIDSCDWTRVELDDMTYDLNSGEIIDWANVTCGKRFMHYDKNFIFENGKDALMFKLKWS